MARNVLVVATVVADEARLREQLGRATGEDVDVVRVVAPAAKLSRLDWLTGDEDAARAEAREAAERVAEELPTDARVEVDRTSHDSDAAEAVADALRTFPADEIVVVTRPGEDASWLEDEALGAALDRAGLPVRHVELPDEHG